MKRGLLWLGFIAEIALLALILTHLSGCSTVTPDQVHAAAPSFDGNVQNSGILAATPAGILVTPHLRDRYNTLVDYYGHDYKPALAKDAGITDAPDKVNYLLDRQHFVQFLEMNQWLKAGLRPTN